MEQINPVSQFFFEFVCSLPHQKWLMPMRWHFRDRTLEDGFRLKNIRIRQPFARNLPYKSEDLMRLFSRLA